MPIERTNEADVALGLSVEIEIEEELDFLTTIAKGAKLFVQRLLDVEREVELGSAVPSPMKPPPVVGATTTRAFPPAEGFHIERLLKRHTAFILVANQVLLP